MQEDVINAKLSDFLIEHREKAQFSQKDVAERSSVYGVDKVLDQRAVSRIEQRPLNTEWLKMVSYLSAIGLQSNVYNDKLKEITLTSKGKEMSTSISAQTTGKIDKQIKHIDIMIERFNSLSTTYMDTSKIVNDLEIKKKAVLSLTNKPIIGCFGAFDAGKSTFINTILGKNLAIESYQPTTSINTLIVHTNDKPKQIKADIAIFESGFLPSMLTDEKAVGDYLLDQGSIDLLKEIGTHTYDNSSSLNTFFAVIFNSNELLKKVWLLDTPGDLSENEQDTKNAFNAVDLVNGILYISSFNGFLSGADLGFFSNILRTKPPVKKDEPLKHIRLIQSHCHNHITEEQVIQTKEKVFYRLQNQLNDLIFTPWLDDNKINKIPETKELIAITHPFWRENTSYVQNIQKEFITLCTSLQDTMNNNITSILDSNYDAILTLIENEMNLLENKKKDSNERESETKERTNHYQKELTVHTNEFQNIIASCEIQRKKDLITVNNSVNSIIDVDNLEAKIKLNYDNKKDAKKNIGDYLSQLIQIELEKSIKKSSENIFNEVDNWLNGWNKTINFNLDGIDLNIDNIGFNTKAAFIGGLSGLGSLGAMSLYVSTIASNLGAYILVGKAAGVLASLGLVSSVTSVSVFVAALGGPITIGIVLAGAIGMLVFSLFNSWERTLAKKVNQAVKKNKIDETLASHVNKFWDDTIKALNACFKELKSESEEYQKKEAKDAERNYDVNELENYIDLLIRMRDYFKSQNS